MTSKSTNRTSDSCPSVERSEAGSQLQTTTIKHINDNKHNNYCCSYYYYYYYYYYYNDHHHHHLCSKTLREENFLKKVRLGSLLSICRYYYYYY